MARRVDPGRRRRPRQAGCGSRLGADVCPRPSGTARPRPPASVAASRANTAPRAGMSGPAIDAAEARSSPRWRISSSAEPDARARRRPPPRSRRRSTPGTRPTCSRATLPRCGPSILGVPVDARTSSGRSTSAVGTLLADVVACPTTRRAPSFSRTPRQQRRRVRPARRRRRPGRGARAGSRPTSAMAALRPIIAMIPLSWYRNGSGALPTRSARMLSAAHAPGLLGHGAELREDPRRRCR